MLQCTDNKMYSNIPSQEGGDLDNKWTFVTICDNGKLDKKFVQFMDTSDY